MSWHIYTAITMQRLFTTADPAVALAWSLWGFFVAEDLLVRVPNGFEGLTAEELLVRVPK